MSEARCLGTLKPAGMMRVYAAVGFLPFLSIWPLVDAAGMVFVYDKSNTLSFHSMVREIEFDSYRSTIEDFRRASYGASITHVLDEFDEQAHHFALFDKKDQVLGVTRILRSDEVKQFEMMRESQLKDLVLPPAKLSLELSRACTIKGSAGIHLLRLCMGINEYAVKNEAEYLITKTGKHLLSLYQHFGFTTFGPPFVSDFFEDKRPIYPIMYRWTVVKREEPEEEVLVW